jgi:FAD/FMN-containing dehydrogenase
MVGMPDLSYSQKKQKLVNDFLELSKSANGDIGLSKSTSNLFRERTKTPTKKLDVRSFNRVIKVNKKELTVEVEGMTTYEELVDATLKQGMMPLVVPELKTITIGGGVSGLAIESSSFKYGLAHESILEMDVMLANGKVVTCSPKNEYSDLFYALPNSYGTLGYVIKLTAKVRPVKPYIRLHHLRFDNPKEYFEKLNEISLKQTYNNESVDFIDGSIFSTNELYITLGFDTDEAPYVSDYTDQKVYYKSIRTRQEDYLTIYDYIWRWDTDWFWCSRIIKADKPLIRRLLGKKRLNSRTYSKMMHFEQRHHIAKRIGKFQRNSANESIIQDVEVPIKNAEKFFSFFNKTIGISPVWVCPTKSVTQDWPYSLYPMDPKSLYINFGFWDSVKTAKDPDEGYYNKLIEAKVEEFGGMKSLYSTSYYERNKFEKIYNYKIYKIIKHKYDEGGRFKDLYEKCVQKH